METIKLLNVGTVDEAMETYKIDGITFKMYPSTAKNLKKFINDDILFKFFINLSIATGSIRIIYNSN